MAYDANVLRRATARLEENKRRREDQREQLRQQLYAREPRLAKLDRQLQGTMAQLVAASLRKGEDAGAAVRAIRDKNLDIQQERAVLLGAMGLPEDALDPKPACPLCNDTGWRGAQMCQCLKELCAQEQIQELSKLLDLGEQSFDTFRLDYYSQTPCPGRGTSPRSNMDLVYEVCLNYAQKFGRFAIKNLFLTGAPGLGKTFLSACIAGSVSQQGFSVSYESAAHLFSKLERERFSPSEENKQAAEAIRNADLLILDDLGTEMPGQFVTAALYTLVNDRLMEGKPMIISTNLNIGEVAQRYNPQIASRLQGSFTRLTFVGEDIRLIMSREGRR